MEYSKVSFDNIEEATKNILVARLSEIGFDGFEEADKALYAYTSQLQKEQLDQITNEYQLDYNLETIQEQNWNAEWEQNFEPVIVEGFCTVRADFHKIPVTTPFEIIVTPKMSFGTGHHATTQLVMQLMQPISFKDTAVLDFGTGTGILAILAEKLGSQNIVAIDNDEWSYSNAKENIDRNKCTHIEVLQGSLEVITSRSFDIILANINRHILLSYMHYMFSRLNTGGKLILSGILPEDEEIVTQTALGAGFSYVLSKAHNNWLAILFSK